MAHGRQARCFKGHVPLPGSSESPETFQRGPILLNARAQTKTCISALKCNASLCQGMSALPENPGGHRGGDYFTLAAFLRGNWACLLKSCIHTKTSIPPIRDSIRALSDSHVAMLPAFTHLSPFSSSLLDCLKSPAQPLGRCCWVEYLSNTCVYSDGLH